MAVSEEQVFEALRAVEDPELGMDVVDLGLVYDVRIDEAGAVTVVYTLTSMGCPAGALIEEQMREVVGTMAGVTDLQLECVWSPPWSPEMMSEDAKFVLGF